MWKCLIIFIGIYRFIACATETESTRDISLTCKPPDDEDVHIVYVECGFFNVSSKNHHLRITADNLHIDKLMELKKAIYVDIVGNDNYPERLPEGFGDALNGTGSLTYKNTPLKFISREDFRSMAPILYSIILEDNKIEEIPHDTFHDLPKLVYLDVRKNKLKYLAPDLFVNSPNFESLIVENNEITKLDSSLFARNPHFETLYAEFNQIDEFPKDIFNNNPQMQIISMRNNKIRKLAIDFRRFAKLDVADFTNNAGSCDTMFFAFEPYHEYYDENERKKWIKTVSEFQNKIEEVCHN